MEIKNMRMPACYATLTSEEMVYVDGGEGEIVASLLTNVLGDVISIVGSTAVMGLTLALSAHVMPVWADTLRAARASFRKDGDILNAAVSGVKSQKEGFDQAYAAISMVGNALNFPVGTAALGALIML